MGYESYAFSLGLKGQITRLMLLDNALEVTLRFKVQRPKYEAIVLGLRV